MEWTNYFNLCLKSKNHLIILRELYSNSKSLKQFKTVNYKTLSRIINNFVKNGIVGKSENNYFLTSKGKLFSYLILGKFESINYEYENKIVVENSNVYIERIEVIQKILFNVKRKNHVFIFGESGIGKTSLLKYLQTNYFKNSVYAEVKPIKYALEQIGNKLKLDFKKTIRTLELLNRIKKVNPDLILLIDNLETATKQSSRIIKELQRSGIVIIGAGQYLKQQFSFDEKIKLRVLNKTECNELVSSLLSQEFENVNEIQELILQNTDKKPENIKRVCEQSKILQELDENIKIRNEIKPTNKKINLISTNTLVNLGYLLITLRYVFYGQKQYEIGYTLSTIAYLIFFFFKRKRK